MSTLIDKYLYFLTHNKKYSINTITSYKNDIYSFNNYLISVYNESDIINSNDLQIRSWFAHLIEKKYSTASVKRKKIALTSFYKFLLKEQKIEKLPITNISIPKSKTKLPEFITVSKLSEIFKSDFYSIQEFNELSKRMIIEFLYSTGLRVSELIELKDSSFNSNYTQVKVIGKGNKERIIPIHFELAKMIKFYTKQKNIAFKNIEVETYFFLTDKGKKTYRKYIYRLVYKALTLITTQTKKGPHIMRHTFATHLLNQGAEINAIKEMLGHTSLAATQIYTHNSVEQLKQIYKNTHPHSKKRRQNENYN